MDTAHKRTSLIRPDVQKAIYKSRAQTQAVSNISMHNCTIIEFRVICNIMQFEYYLF